MKMRFAGGLVIPATLTVAVIGVLSGCSSSSPTPQDAAAEVAVDSGLRDASIADTVATDVIVNEGPTFIDSGCPNGILFCIPDRDVDAGHGGSACTSSTCDPMGCPVGCRAVG